MIFANSICLEIGSRNQITIDLLFLMKSLQKKQGFCRTTEMAVTDHLQGQRTKCLVHGPGGTQPKASWGLMAPFLLELITASSQQSEGFSLSNYATNFHLVAYIWAVIFKVLDNCLQLEFLNYFEMLLSSSSHHVLPKYHMHLVSANSYIWN